MGLQEAQQEIVCGQILEHLDFLLTHLDVQVVLELELILSQYHNSFLGPFFKELYLVFECLCFYLDNSPNAFLPYSRSLPPFPAELESLV